MPELFSGGLKTMILQNPISGAILKRDSPHSLSDGEMRFPIVDEIPFLRIGREDLTRETLRALDLNDEKAALVLLLRDRDDWAKGEPANENDLRQLVENVDDINLREAMKLLNYGAVADYFAFRWSDPTFLSGLALLQSLIQSSKFDVQAGSENHVLEICCGIGHYLREFSLRGISAVGVDVVFSKLWLARKFVSPEISLVCCDVNFGLPFQNDSFETFFCHDAFYFLPDKQLVIDEAKRVTTHSITIGHAHNAEVDNFSSGEPLTVHEYAKFLDDAIFYDDYELTQSVIENRTPQPQSIERLRNSAAISFVKQNHEIETKRDFSLPISNRNLRINPLLLNGDEILNKPNFSSERYEKEYGELSEYLNLTDAEIAQIERGEHLEDFARRRVLLSLPEKW
ncbi:MAG: class I SAM-dependent methyltransferase [Pyrinomonadaceae bacterium]|nr:class I SAM-dependent methyltransferase [Pyrinomonadaceae bacterium]